MEDWHRLAPPKSDNQWKDGRSAKESAKAWCGNGICVPTEIVALLNSHPQTADVTFLTVTPEHQVRFDKVKGEPRNADVVCVARAAGALLAISIEAKADEPFGSYVGDVAAEAIDKLSHGIPTGALTRLEGLVAAVLPARGERQPKLADIRYQLLTAAAGAIAYAEEVSAQRAVLIVHEFVTDQTSDDRRKANAEDLNRFVRRLSGGTVNELTHNLISGPFAIPGTPLFTRPVELFIGKTTRFTRTR